MSLVFFLVEVEVGTVWRTRMWLGTRGKRDGRRPNGLYSARGRFSLWIHVTRTPDHTLLFAGSLGVSRFRETCL